MRDWAAIPLSSDNIAIALGILGGEYPKAKVALLVLEKVSNLTDAIELIELCEAEEEPSAALPLRRPLYQRQPRTKKYGPLQDPNRYMSDEKRRAYNLGHYLGTSEVLSYRLPEREWLPLVGQVFRRDKFTCTYCGAHGSEYALHCDHIVPISRGGTNDLDNLTTSCDFCNCSKRDLMPHEWRPIPGLPELVE